MKESNFRDHLMHMEFNIAKLESIHLINENERWSTEYFKFKANFRWN